MDTTDDPLGRARRVVLAVLTVEVAVLVVTGVALFFVYRPTDHTEWFGGNETSSVRLSHVVRFVHQVTSLLAGPTVIALAVLLVVGAKPAIKRLRGTLLGGATAVSVLAASLTGTLLPWDQLAVRAVTVGTSMQGFRPLFGHDVRFVIMNGSEISLHEIFFWLVIHMLVLGAVVVALVGAAWRYVRRERAPAFTPASGGPSR